MAYHTTRLWPTMAHMDPTKASVRLKKLKETGAYGSWEELLETHIDLLSEDFLCCDSEQVNAIRADPKRLDEDPRCYLVKGKGVFRQKTKCGRFARVVGTEFTFDPSKYADVEWEKEKRLMRNNLVFLTTDRLETFLVGQITVSEEEMLREGSVVVRMHEPDFDVDGYPVVSEPEDFVNKTYYLVESEALHFPYAMVTKTLRQEVRGRRNSSSVLSSLGDDVAREMYTSSMSMDWFQDEIVFCNLPSRPPEYLDAYRSEVEDFFTRMSAVLNDSQAEAIRKVLQYRVALVQGPPGTGKSFLGRKLAELFVELKNTDCYEDCCSPAHLAHLRPGPVVVIATSNHAVEEFLRRCDFTEKVVHSCSNEHKRGVVLDNPFQEEHDQYLRNSDKASVLWKADVIGMTTSRGACIRKDLDGMNIKTVIVEEAAQVLEAHVLACIPRGAKHLIMIGDHLQLRAGCAHEALGREYHLDLSLFERMVNNGADVPMLTEQRRMRPAIADLVRPVYPKLTDHKVTLGRGRLRGVDLDEPVFFMNHVYSEVKETRGYSNPAEAEIAVELACLLVRRDYPAETITILVTYRRQLRLITQMIQQHSFEGIKGVKVCTVDGYQGEENDIVILSLVRSNPSGDIGFLKTANRATVALSRARNGFFMLGNLACLLSSGAAVWQNVERVLSAAGRVGAALPLLCPRHAAPYRYLAHSAGHVRAAMGSCCLCERKAALERAMAAVSLDG